MRDGCRAAIAAIAAAGAVCSGAEQGPSGPWRTVRTEHFLVHYPEPFERWALRTASRIESIHARVTAVVGYTPGAPIDVLVMDPMADANGMAIPLLDRSAIVLWTHPPGAESGIGFYRDWGELLVTHEVAHVVHLARPRNRSRRILARLSPLPAGPLALRSPRWVTEGYATLVEGELTGSGRPHGSFRAMVVRRLAVDGKLPAYDRLNATGGWLGGSMAYLVGSSYLEWLTRREGADVLPRLWKRMASRRGGGFPEAFRGVFTEGPRDLYDRFVAETTAAAMAEERRLRDAGLVEGDLWQRLEGGTSSLDVSRDGRYVLARRDRSGSGPRLVVWEMEESAEEKEREEKRKEREAKLLEDPQEVADRPEVPRPRDARWVLRAPDGRAPSTPRFMPDGSRVLLTLRTPDRHGVRHGDLYLWRLGGGLHRVTTEADLFMADPGPDGRWAVAVQNRHGESRLVRVDLVEGIAATLPVADASPDDVWNHPRISPDGRRLAALRHRAGSWRLVTVELRDGATRELDVGGNPAGPPEWSVDGQTLFVASDRHGTWNLEQVDAERASPSQTRTLVVGGALSPAASPDGAVFFVEVSSRGMNVRRLPLSGPLAPAAPPRGSESSAVMPPVERVVREAPAEVPVSPGERYRVTESHRVRTAFAYAAGPDGIALQVGADGGDAIGRLHWMALGSLGDRAGPWGASVAVAWRGLPVSLTGQLFVARERPGDQRLLERPELDQARVGIDVDARHVSVSCCHRLELGLGAGASRVDVEDAGVDVSRALAHGDAAFSWQRSRGPRSFGFGVGTVLASGSTDGDAWSLTSGQASIWASVDRIGRARIAARAGGMGGDPTSLDVFSLGGAPSTILPAGLDVNRIGEPALPAHVQLGDRHEGVRVEVGPSWPVVVYAALDRVWEDGTAKPEPMRVLGVEARAGAGEIPLPLAESLHLYAGVARVDGDAPEISGVTAYAGLLYRP